MTDINKVRQAVDGIAKLTFDENGNIIEEIEKFSTPKTIDGIKKVLKKENIVVRGTGKTKDFDDYRREKNEFSRR